MNKTLESTLNNRIGTVNDYKNHLNRRHNLYNENININDHDGDSTPVPPRQVSKYLKLNILNDIKIYHIDN